MGFYINDDYWAAVKDFSPRVQNELLGAMTRLYYTGVDQLDGISNKTARSIYLATRERVSQARSKSNRRRKSTGENDDFKADTGTLRVQDQNSDFAKKREREIYTYESNQIENLPTMGGADFPAQDPEPWVEFVGQALSRFEAVTGRACRIPSSDVTLSLRRIFDAGYTVDDVEAVCRSKLAEWGNDAKMSRYLRPETVFGSKFEGYLAAAKADPAKEVHDAASEFEGAF